MDWDPCAKCEELLQPFLDRMLTDEERQVAEAHLDLCSYCRRRYRFEVRLRRFVRDSAIEPMPPQLLQRLVNLRMSL